MSRDEWWLDYVEDELDAETRKEMKALLKHSRKDQDIVKSLSDTKSLIQETPENLPALSEEKMMNLHDKIMSGVGNTRIREKPKIRLRRIPKKILKSASLTLCLLVLGLLASRLGPNKGLNTQWEVPGQMAAHSHDDGNELGLVMSYQSEHDFFVDVASLSLDHLTNEQFESLVK